MLTASQVETFRRDGCLQAGAVLSDESVEELRLALDRTIARHDTARDDRVYIGDTAAFCQRRHCFLQVTNIRELSEAFAAVAQDRQLAGMAGALLGQASLRVFADGVLFKSGRQRGLNDWHQDGPSFDILREPEAVLTAWIALDDVTEEDGPVCVAHGSHTWTLTRDAAAARLNTLLGNLPENTRGAAAPLTLGLMRRGRVHFHHGLTWHCSLENRSGRPRRGFVIHYMSSGARYAAAGGHFLREFVECGDGEPVRGKHFPRVEPATP